MLLLLVPVEVCGQVAHKRAEVAGEGKGRVAVGLVQLMIKGNES